MKGLDPKSKGHLRRMKMIVLIHNKKVIFLILNVSMMMQMKIIMVRKGLKDNNRIMRANHI